MNKGIGFYIIIHLLRKSKNNSISMGIYCLDGVIEHERGQQTFSSHLFVKYQALQCKYRHSLQSNFFFLRYSIPQVVKVELPSATNWRNFIYFL